MNSMQHNRSPASITTTITTTPIQQPLF